MSKYRAFETKQLQKDLAKITKSGRQRMIRKHQEIVYPQLKQHPHFGPNIKKLMDFEPETWRYRIGAWRFFFEIDDEEKIVSMIAAQHRSSAYQR